MKLNRGYYPDQFDQFEQFSDFVAWANTAEAGFRAVNTQGLVTLQDAAGGVIQIAASNTTNASQTADNDECYLKGVCEAFKFAADKPLTFQARVKPISNSINTTNVIVGLKDAVAADSIQDNGAGPPSSYSGAVFFLADDATNKWKCETSVGTSQTTVTTTKTVTNSTWYELRIDVLPISSTQCEVHFFIDGEECGQDVTTSPGNKIAQKVTFASATEMEICLGTKAGAADKSAILQVDYVACRQQR